jgi:hypothetical protein
MVQDYLRTVRGNENRLAKAKKKLVAEIKYQVKDIIKIYSDTDFTFADINFAYGDYHYVLGKGGLFVSTESIPLTEINPNSIPFEKFDANDLLKVGEDIGKARDLYDELEREAMPVYRAAKKIFHLT